jgi:tRNA(adenine34) deaminase
VTELHDRFMQEALAQARLAAEMGEVPVGAVVVRGDQVIAAGHNRREIDQDPTAHAELLAVREAAAALGSWRLDNCTVYVTLEPCSMCAGAMVLARVERCVYGTTDPKGGFVGTLGDLSDHPGLNHRFAVVSGVLAGESSKLLKDFFKQLRSRRRKLNGS